MKNEKIYRLEIQEVSLKNSKPIESIIVLYLTQSEFIEIEKKFRQMKRV